MNVNGLIRTVATVSLLVGVGALAQESDTPLAEAIERQGPSTAEVITLTTSALRDEREWLYDHQPTMGDIARPSILLVLGAATSAFGVWWFADFMTMTPAYRENLEWLAVGVIATGAILSGLMGTLIGIREKRRVEYQARLSDIHREFRQRKHAPAPAPAPLPSEPLPPPPLPAGETPHSPAA